MNFPSFKLFTKSTFPRGAEVFARTKEKVLSSFFGIDYVSSVFSTIYEQNLWGNSESRSGRCSTLEATNIVRQQLPELLKRLEIRSLLDAPCGDFNWMQTTEIELEKYIGADIVPGMIARNQKLYSTQNREFMVIDITRNEIPSVDLIFCSDCLIHLSFKYIIDSLENFKRSRSKYLLTTTYTLTQENRDILTGDCRFINLQLSPFNLPEPLARIVEEPEHGKSLALWRFADMH